MLIPIIIVISLILIGWFGYSKIKKDTVPPPITYPQCPDYWESIATNKCKNVHSLGQCRLGNDPDNIIDFNTDTFLNEATGNYMKCKWASDCGISWEGINKLC